MFIPTTRAELDQNHQISMEILQKSFIPFVVTNLYPSPVDFILLYGSRARGDYHWLSDFDFLICSEYFSPINFLDRADKLNSFKFSHPMEIICYTPREAHLAMDQFNLTILDALEEGVVLYSHWSVLDDLRSQFDGLKRKQILRKEKTTPLERSYWRIITPVI